MSSRSVALPTHGRKSRAYTGFWRGAKPPRGPIAELHDVA